MMTSYYVDLGNEVIISEEPSIWICHQGFHFFVCLLLLLFFFFAKRQPPKLAQKLSVKTFSSKTEENIPVKMRLPWKHCVP